jgi:hypothetical protein
VWVSAMSPCRTAAGTVYSDTAQLATPPRIPPGIPDPVDLTPASRVLPLLPGGRCNRKLDNCNMQRLPSSEQDDIRWHLSASVGTTVHGTVPENRIPLSVQEFYHRPAARQHRAESDREHPLCSLACLYACLLAEGDLVPS